MTRKGKIFLAFAVVCFLLGGLLAAHFTRKKSTSQPTIILPDKTELRLVAVTWGTNHFVGTSMQRFLSRLPQRLLDIVGPPLQRLSGKNAAPPRSLTTTSPTLMLWMQPYPPEIGLPLQNLGLYKASWLQTNSHMVSAMLGDEVGYFSGQQQSISGIGFYICGFTAFPRREKTIRLQLFQRDRAGGAQRLGGFTFPSPLYKTYPTWKPEPLPATKMAGDLSVTLLTFRTGYGHGTTYKSLPNGRSAVFFGLDGWGAKDSSVGTLRIQSPRGTNEIWKVTHVESCDATGNCLAQNSLGTGVGTYFQYSPSLWPNESAWKIRLELKRENNFADSELLVFTNIALGPMNSTNQVGITQQHSGLQLTLRSIIRRSPMTSSSWSSSDLSEIALTHSPLPAGMHIDLVRLETDTGIIVPTGGSGRSGTEITYNIKALPLDARKLQLTFAFHRSRYVEFVVKPAMGKPDEPIYEY